MNILEFFNFTFLNQSYSDEAVEIFLRNASFSTLFISMMFYWIQTAFSSTKKIALPLTKEMKEGVSFQSHPLSLATPSSPLASSPLSVGEVQALLPLPAKGLRPYLPIGTKSKPLLTSKMLAPLWGPTSSKEEGKGQRELCYAQGEQLYEVLQQRHNTTKDAEKTTKLTSFGTISMILSNFLLMCLLIFRWKESGHFPLSNLYESLMFLSWSCTCIHLILDQVVKTAVVRLDATLLTKLIGSITSPSAFFTNAFATFSLPPEMQKASPLVPALQSNWLMMHVTVMIISYSALILGSLLSIAFLILISANPSSSGPSILFSPVLLPAISPAAAVLRTAAAPLVSKGSSIRSIGSGVVATNAHPPVGGKALLFEESQLFNMDNVAGVRISPTLLNSEGGALVKQPSLQDQRNQNQQLFQKTKNDLAWNFDNLSYRVLGIGFPFLTIGILSGAVWANEAWGSYWSWDPKETWALLTWLIFAIYLHARITKGWQGKKPAIIASFGFLAIWVCFLGVNLIGEGLHSYGWFSS